MTDRTRRNLEIASLAIFSIVFGAGAGWGSTQVRVSTIEGNISDIRSDVKEIKGRVAEMYCAQVPLSQRAGCR